MVDKNIIKYDENNNLIHSKDSDGCEKWYGPNGDEINPIETKSAKYELTEEEYNTIIEHLKEINKIIDNAKK